MPYIKMHRLAISAIRKLNMEEIIDKWQRIVELTKQNMSEIERRKFAKTSVRYIVRLLGEKIAKSEQETSKIVALFTLYKNIKHHDYQMSAEESIDFLNFANILIERLEQIK
jgi:hypothetical protein